MNLFGKSVLCVATALISYVGVVYAQTAVSDVLQYQGRLLENPTDPAANRTFQMRFSLWAEQDYDAATDLNGTTGALIGAAWEEVQTFTTDAQGFFMLEIGSSTALPVMDFAVHKYLQAEVKSDGGADTTYYLLDPMQSHATIDRTSIADSAYAHNAGRLDGRDTGTNPGDIPYLDENGELDRSLLDQGTWLDPVADLTARDALTGMDDGAVVFVESENALYTYYNSSWAEIGSDISYDDVLGEYDFGDNRLSNVADPTDDDDAANKGYVDGLFTSINGNGTYVGVTSGSHSGSAGGYVVADALCQADFASSHVCRTEEIFNTITMEDISTLFSYTSLTGAWILEGPPGYTAPANDCNGLTDGTADYLGAFWQFNNTTGGVGQLSICSQQKPFACCR